MVNYEVSHEDVAEKKIQILKLWMLHSHVQHGSTEALQNQHSSKVGTKFKDLTKCEIWSQSLLVFLNYEFNLI